MSQEKNKFGMNIHHVSSCPTNFCTRRRHILLDDSYVKTMHLSASTSFASQSISFPIVSNDYLYSAACCVSAQTETTNIYAQNNKFIFSALSQNAGMLLIRCSWVVNVI